MIIFNAMQCYIFQLDFYKKNIVFNRNYLKIFHKRENSVVKLDKKFKTSYNCILIVRD